MPPFRPTPVLPIYYFGNKKSNTILVQMVERHQVRYMDNEVSMIREFSGTDDFLLACVRVTDWNEDLTPWRAPGLFGKSDFSGRGPQTLDYLLKDMIPMILHEHTLAVAGKIEPYADYSSLFPPSSSGSEDSNASESTIMGSETGADGSDSQGATPSTPAAPAFDPTKLFNPAVSKDAKSFDSGSSLGIRISGVNISKDANSKSDIADSDFSTPKSNSANLKSAATSDSAYSDLPSDSAGVRLFLGGYSLAALFCLWTAYQTDIFSGIAAASPSLWYPDFVEYMEENQIFTDAVYLSLGTKEEKIRNRVMSRVGDAVRAADEILSREGILNTLEWNPGKHFQDAEKRTAMGFAWLLKNRFAWTLLD